MSLWLPEGPCTVASCVSAPVDAAGRVRRASRLLGALLVVLAGLPWALVAGRFGDTRQAVATMLWARAFLRVLGVRLAVRPGEPHAGGALLVANHISWLDPLVVAATVPCRAVAKAEIARWPVIRSLVAGGGTIFIDRDRLSTLPATVRVVAGALRDGRSVVAFPEGTTWCGRGMGPFRPAMFQAAIDSGAPVRPIGLRFCDREGRLATGPAFVGDDTLLASLLRVVAARGLVAEVTMFPVITHEGRDDVTRRALAEAARTVLTGEPAPVTGELVPHRHELTAAA
ncbi:lysophospholipid acyltransferase family protein [Sphaerisporangium corydalis]|uniref:Lysophospholipid acyltransferase family protein n=1 Tax=Sphaerisporangium corydalis TaxID=1441875 RepID=A0ABV9EKD3_9ACTN|nr:lysophospholipid acyltransferase family protein [Sphaerisporangium corydalis]